MPDIYGKNTDTLLICNIITLIWEILSHERALKLCYMHISGVPRNFFHWRGVQQIQLRTEDRQNGDLGAVAPYTEVLEAAVILYKKFHFI
jgi:hypothetical protein